MNTYKVHIGDSFFQGNTSALGCRLKTHSLAALVIQNQVNAIGGNRVRHCADYLIIGGIIAAAFDTARVVLSCFTARNNNTVADLKIRIEFRSAL